MNKTLKSVQQFHEVFNHPVGEKPRTINSERGVLRLNLILEELGELAIALGLQIEYKTLLSEKLNKSYITMDISKIEQLDAYADLQYVLNGAILESGMQNIFDEAFALVHESNMTKVCITEEQAVSTVKWYTEQGIECYYELVDKYFIVYRTEDNKILKAVSYKPVNLKRLLDVEI